MGLKQQPLLFLAIVLTAVGGTACQADQIAVHSGSADPTTEGWSEDIGTGGNVSVGAINDGGTAAWFVDDNGTTSGSIFFYEQAIFDADIAIGNNIGWMLSATLRVSSDEATTIDGSPFIAYRDGVNTWQMNFGLNSSGDMTVRLYETVSTGPVHTSTGNASYNTFLLRYDPVAANADLFVNGTEVISNYVGEANAQKRVVWGAGRSADSGQGNFSGVSFVTVPEPTSALFLVAGAFVICWKRQRNKRRQAL